MVRFLLIVLGIGLAAYLIDGPSDKKASDDSLDMSEACEDTSDQGFTVTYTGPETGELNVTYDPEPGMKIDNSSINGASVGEDPYYNSGGSTCTYESSSRECTACNGSGNCWHCNGTLYVANAKCSVCRGTGRCRNCHGSGSRR